MIDRSLTAVVAPGLQATFQLDDTGFGLIHGPAYAIVHAAGLLVVGLYVDRLDRFRLMGLGVLGWTLGNLICALAESIEVFVLGRMLMGTAQAVFMPAAVALILDRAPSGRAGLALSAFTAASATGRSAAMILGGAGLALIGLIAGSQAMLAGIEDWRALLLLSCAPNLLLAAALLTLSDPGRIGSRERARVWRWMADRAAMIAPHGLAAVCVVLLTHAATAWGPSLLHRAHGFGQAEAGLAMGFGILAGAPLGHLLGGWGVDRLRALGRPEGLLLVVALAAAGGAGVWLGAAPSPSQAILAYGLLAACLAVASLTALAVFAGLSPPGGRGGAAAVFFALTSLVGATAGPPLVGLVSDARLSAFGGQLGGAVAIVVAAASAVGVLAALASLHAGRRRGVAT